MRSLNFRIAAAVATALSASAASTQVFALDAATTAAIPASRTLVIAGASAARDAVEAAVRDSLCAAGTFTRFRVNSTNAPDLRAYSCSLRNPGVVSGVTIVNPALQGLSAAFYYRSEGGSIYGPGSIAKNVAVARLVVTSACTVADGANSFLCPVNTGSPGSGGYTLLPADTGGGANVSHQVAQLGVSDLEPAMFTGENWPDAGVLAGEPGPGVMAGLPAVPVLGQAFGIVVRSSQTLTSLTKQDISGIFAGNYGDWSQINGSGTTGLITICRREPGSGTQTGASVYFLGANCSSGNAGAFVRAPANDLFGNTVVENPTSSSVTTCMSDSPLAIGIVVGNAAPALTKFVSISGSPLPTTTIAPKHIASLGQSDYWYEATFTKASGLATNVGFLADDLTQAAQDSSTLPNVPSAFGLAGLGAPGSLNVAALAPLQGATPTIRPVALARRGGTAGNSCGTPQPGN